jgi:MoxR-like ATPase
LRASHKVPLIGRQAELGLLIAALRSDVSVLLEGPPGTSKSTLVQFALESLHRTSLRISGSADFTPAKLMGSFDPSKVLSLGYQRELFQQGPLTEAMSSGAVLFIEELNRFPTEVLNLLIPAISDRRLTVPRVGEIQAAEGFCVVGTINPTSDVGVAQMGEALRDRWCSLWVGYQGEVEERAIVGQLAPDADAETVAWAVDIVRATRRHPDVRQGASVRAAIDLARLSSTADAAGNDRNGLARMTLRSRISPMSLDADFRERVLEELVEKKKIGRRRVASREDFEIMQHHLPLPETHSHEAFDAKLAKAVQAGELDVLVEWGRRFPRRVAQHPDLQVKNVAARGGVPRHVLFQAVGGLIPGLSGRELEDTMSQQLHAAVGRWTPRAQQVPPELAVSDVGGDEIDIDATVDRCADSGVLRPIARGWSRPVRELVLLLDDSGSMAGYRWSLVVTLAAALQRWARQVYRLRVFVFSDDVQETTPSASEFQTAYHLIKLESRGLTDIGRAIATVLPRIDSRGRVILVTDGRDNVGQPTALRGLGTPIDVVLVGDEERSVETDGRVMFLRDLGQIDDVVSTISSTNRVMHARRSA